MPLPRAARARLVWALELSLGLELYACAVLALHARGLRATPLEASAALVLPALRHRVILSPAAEIDGRKVDDVVRAILERVEAPR